MTVHHGAATPRGAAGRSTILEANRPGPALKIDQKSGPGPKPYEFIGFGDIHGPKPYEFIGFGDMLATARVWEERLGRPWEIIG